jgi:tetratricopeptide (TPR) repeat protein
MEESRQKFALPAGIPATSEDAEKKILNRLQQDVAELTGTLWRLFLFYQSIDRNDLSAGVIKMLMQYCEGPERQAYCYLILGQLAEKDRLYTAALDQYARALELKPNNQRTLYFLYNNTGYCLNLLARYKEGERCCRQAIEIDGWLANAHKNLGVSLAGQKRMAEAFCAHIEALRRFYDPNSLENPFRRILD